jgi:UDPglucose 6-dehydrogenase
VKIGWVGLGRLGAPCAAALAKHGGHDVVGYDVRGPEGTYDWSEQPAVKVVPRIDDVIEHADVVFLAVQTPHEAEYGGEDIVPLEPREFEYAFLINAVHSVATSAEAQRKPITLVIVSTVLPGTFNRELRPLLNGYVTPVYHPFFIAMGTVVDDFLRPEMTLYGVERAGDEDVVREVYAPLHSAPAPVLSIASAELAKVAYNTYISMKIVFANTVAQLADGTGADVDEVTQALALGTDRLMSPRYLTAGMGDGGACHPRDNVALSALAQRVGAYDLMGMLTRAREDHTRWLAALVEHWLALTKMRYVTILGKTYKPNVKLIDGSPALLLLNILELAGITVNALDPLLDSDTVMAVQLRVRGVFVVATRHEEFRNLTVTPGSVVIDPFGYVTVPPGVTLVTPGRRRPRSGR